MKINGIAQIETSALCNKKCPYCPHGKGMTRQLGLMDMETFKRSIHWVKYFREQPFYQSKAVPLSVVDVNIHGLGEPLLNPQIFDMAEYAVKTCPNVPFRICTNCSLLTEDIYRRLRKIGLYAIDFTDHDAKDTARALQLREKYVMKGNTSRDAVTQPHNWAGNADWFVSDFNPCCLNLEYGVVCVTWDGRIVSCCLDANNEQVLGHVNDNNVTELETIQGVACARCHYRKPK